MSRASEEFLAQLHGLVGESIKEMLQSDDLRERHAGIQAGMRFLKDNNITTTIEASVPMQDIRAAMPTPEELERLMTMTPD